MGWLDKTQEWMTPERAAAFQGLGMGLSQMDAGRPVDMSPAYAALEQRRQQTAMRKMMEVPGVMNKFSPEQQAVLAAMPEGLATQIIMEHAFKAQEPVAGVNVGGNLVNPYTGEVMYSAPGEAPAPYSDIAKINADLQAGLITPEQAQAAMAGGSTTEYGTSLQFYTDPQTGKLSAGVVGKDGTFKGVEPPNGGEWAQGVDKVDAGDKWLFYDKRTGQMVGEEPKNLRGAESEKALGKAEGEAAGEAVTGLGNAMAKGEQALGLIDQIATDPALPSILGIVQGNIPAGTPIVGGGQAGADLGAKIEQLQGQVFLEAFESLKGAGQITEIEGLKAERAKARLQRSQSPEAYKAALTELREVIEGGMKRAQEKASKASAPEAATGGVTEFSTMGLAEIGQVDIGSLTPEQMDALEARMTELGL